MVFDQGYRKGIVHIDGDDLPILEAQQESFSASWSPYNLDVPVHTIPACRIFLNLVGAPLLASISGTTTPEDRHSG